MENDAFIFWVLDFLRLKINPPRNFEMSETTRLKTYRQIPVEMKRKCTAYNPFNCSFWIYVWVQTKIHSACIVFEHGSLCNPETLVTWIHETSGECINEFFLNKKLHNKFFSSKQM
jgi:hypothetical protein